MRNSFWRKFIKNSVFGLATIALGAGIVQAQQAQRARFDVTNYRIEAQIVPAANSLTTTADVTLTPLDATRTFIFELNGALKVESVTRVAAVQTQTLPPLRVLQPRNQGNRPAQTATAQTPATAAPTTAAAQVTFIQDQVGVSDLGPSVRVDLGETVQANVPLTLRFRYAGTLITPEGGPLTSKKLASVDDTVSYLTYAGRWFPFHDYAADRATAEIFVSAPAGVQVVGYSDEPVAQSAQNGNARFRFVHTKPALIGNIAAGKFAAKTLRFANTELQFYVQPANENKINGYAETLGRAFEFYTRSFGAPDWNKYVIAQIDDESLDAFSGAGTLFLSTRFFENAPLNITERLQREAALQWWGQTVGLKSFDDAWLSQGLAEYSALDLRESTANSVDAENLNRELLERALTFEQTASLLRAPSTLDDQSAAYQYIVFYKGSAVFRLLRETLGRDKFNQLLKTYLAQYRGKNASIDDFEKLASAANGAPLRYFFARWVEGTGVPEFKSDYQIIRTRAGKFVARGTVRQNYDNLRLPVEVKLRAEGDDSGKTQTLRIEEASEDFTLESTGKPLEVVIDPNYKLLRIDPDLRVSAIARRGIEQFKEGNYAEAQTQFEAALKLDRSNSWVYYHLGLLFLEQRNYDLAIDNLKAALNGSLRPGWLRVWAEVKMGNAYDAKGDRDRAKSAYDRAIALGDNYNGAQDAAKKFLGNPYDPRAKDNTARQ